MDRVGAARERVRIVQAELGSPARHSPCIKCRYYELVCTHPAVAEFRIDPETGKGKSTPAFAKDARSETGACGPEGALFDSRSPVGLAVVSAFSAGWGWWVTFGSLAILADWLLT